MKRNRITAAALAACLALSLAACGETTTQDPVQAAQERLQDVKSMESDVVMDMAFQVPSGTDAAAITLAERMRMEIVTFTDPLKLKAEVAVSLDFTGAGLDNQEPMMSMTMYAAQEGDAYNMYITDGASWQSQSVALEDLGQYDAQENLEFYLDSSESFTQAGSGDVNGAPADRYDGVIKGKDMEQVLRASGALDALDSLNLSSEMDAEKLKEIYSDLPDLPCSLWIDQKSGYPVQYEMDMTALMNQVLTRLVGAVDGSAGDADGLAVEQMRMTMTCSGFNAAEDFEIPAEARAA
ncbi:hypothetical protein CE91St41_31000 [Oscillospiraceae bacterium]|nr:hypothetical protein CE91St40_31000 [Oscillospiraceae bacterium]BDF76211.1 hypothetical protein CE91St41_31000 [Oscillospiraceae bacterium]